MASGKIKCGDCDYDILIKNYGNHFKPQKHIKNYNVRLNK